MVGSHSHFCQIVDLISLFVYPVFHENFFHEFWVKKISSGEVMHLLLTIGVIEEIMFSFYLNFQEIQIQMATSIISTVNQYIGSI